MLISKKTNLATQKPIRHKQRGKLGCCCHKAGYESIADAADSERTGGSGQVVGNERAVGVRKRNSITQNDCTSPRRLRGNTPIHIDKPIRSHRHHEVRRTHTVHEQRDEFGRKMINEYLILKTLGRGAISKVKLAVNTQTNEYVVRGVF